MVGFWLATFHDLTNMPLAHTPLGDDARTLHLEHRGGGVCSSGKILESQRTHTHKHTGPAKSIAKHWQHIRTNIGRPLPVNEVIGMPILTQLTSPNQWMTTRWGFQLRLCDYMWLGMIGGISRNIKNQTNMHCRTGIWNRSNITRPHIPLPTASHR